MYGETAKKKPRKFDQAKTPTLDRHRASIMEEMNDYGKATITGVEPQPAVGERPPDPPPSVAVPEPPKSIWVERVEEPSFEEQVQAAEQEEREAQAAKAEQQQRLQGKARAYKDPRGHDFSDYVKREDDSQKTSMFQRKLKSDPTPATTDYTTADESQNIVDDIINLGATTSTGVTPVTVTEGKTRTSDFLEGVGGVQITGSYPGGVKTLNIDESTQTAQRGRFTPTGYAPEFTETVDTRGIHGSSMFPDISGIQLGERGSRGGTPTGFGILVAGVPRYTTVQGSTQRETPQPQYTTPDKSQDIFSDMVNLGATASTGIETSADYQPDAPIRTGLSPQQKADAGIGIGAARGSGPAGRGFLSSTFVEEQTSRGVVSDYDTPKSLTKTRHYGSRDDPYRDTVFGFGDNFEVDAPVKGTSAKITTSAGQRKTGKGSDPVTDYMNYGIYRSSDSFQPFGRNDDSARATLDMVAAEKQRRAAQAAAAARDAARGESGTEVARTSSGTGPAPQVFDDMGNVIGTTATTPRPPMRTGMHGTAQTGETRLQRIKREAIEARNQAYQDDRIGLRGISDMISPRQQYGSVSTGDPVDPFRVNAGDVMWNTTLTTPRSSETSWYRPETDEFKISSNPTLWASREEQDMMTRDASGDTSRYGLGNQTMIPGTSFSIWESQLGGLMGGRAPPGVPSELSKQVAPNIFESGFFSNLDQWGNVKTPPRTTTRGSRGSGKATDTHYSGTQTQKGGRTSAYYGMQDTPDEDQSWGHYLRNPEGEKIPGTWRPLGSAQTDANYRARMKAEEQQKSKSLFGDFY